MPKLYYNKHNDLKKVTLASMLTKSGQRWLIPFSFFNNTLVSELHMSYDTKSKNTYVNVYWDKLDECWKTEPGGYKININFSDILDFYLSMDIGFLNELIDNHNKHKIVSI